MENCKTAPSHIGPLPGHGIDQSRKASNNIDKVIDFQQTNLNVVPVVEYVAKDTAQASRPSSRANNRRNDDNVALSIYKSTVLQLSLPHTAASSSCTTYRQQSGIKDKVLASPLFISRRSLFHVLQVGRLHLEP
jgi:hypothetical protein